MLIFLALFGSGILVDVAKNIVLLSVNVAISGVYTFAVNIVLLLSFAAMRHHINAPTIIITAAEITPIINFVRFGTCAVFFAFFTEFNRFF